MTKHEITVRVKKYINCIYTGQQNNATPVHSAKIGKFQNTITSSKMVISGYLKNLQIESSIFRIAT